MTDEEVGSAQEREAGDTPVAAFLIPPDFPQVVEFDFNTLMSYGRLTPQVLDSIRHLLETLQQSFLETADSDVLRCAPHCLSHGGCEEHSKGACPPRCISHAVVVKAE